MFSSRTHIARCLIVALVAVPGFLTTGCFSKQTAPQVAAPPAAPAPAPAPVPQRSGVFGTAKATAGVNADLRGLRITAHASLEHLRNYVRSALAHVNGSGLEVSWDMTVTPGTYFILAWMDNNNDGVPVVRGRGGDRRAVWDPERGVHPGPGVGRPDDQRRPDQLRGPVRHPGVAVRQGCAEMNHGSPRK